MKFSAPACFSLTVFVIFFCVSCGEKYRTVHRQFMLVDKFNLKDDTLITDRETGRPFSRLQRPNTFGRTYVYTLSEKQRGKGFYVIFKGKIRSNYAESNATITVSLHNEKKEQLAWLPLFLRRHFFDINKWCYFQDSIRVEPLYKWNKVKTISCMPYLSNSSAERFDVDTLEVTIKEEK